MLPSHRTAALSRVAFALIAAPAHAAQTPDLVIANVRRTEGRRHGLRPLTVTTRARNTGRSPPTPRPRALPDPGRQRLGQGARARGPIRTSAADALLEGERAVAPLRAGATSPAARAKVTVPATLAPGAYTLLACADDRGAVRESDEANQCRAAKGKLKVTAAADAPSAWHSIADELPLLEDIKLAQRQTLAQQLSCTPPWPRSG